MAKFRKKGGKETPAISTASLPDIIFILLFFFMVITVIREISLMVENRLPQATEITKLKKKSLVSYIYIGKPKPKYRDELGNAPRIQLNDQFASLDEIGAFVVAEREDKLERDRDKMTFSLKVDKETKMGIVSDVKFQLRKADALKINYSSRPGEDISVQ